MTQPAFEYSQEEKDLIRDRHLRNMEDEVYAEGFQSDETDNPYLYPAELCLQVRELAMKDGALTGDEKVELKARREKFEATKWDRWSAGNHMRSFLPEHNIEVSS